MLKKIHVDKFMNKFKKFYNSSGLKASYDTKELYYKIKEEYKTRIKENSIDIKSERIRLECNIGKYYSIDENMCITAFISILVSVAISIYFKKAMEQIAKNFSPKNEFLVYLIGSISIIIFLGICFWFEIKKSLEKRTLYNICLKALEDIEKENDEVKEAEKRNQENEIQEKLLKIIKVLYKAYNEVSEYKNEGSEDIRKIKKFMDIK